MVEPPVDRGWAWVVCFGIFMILTIHPGSQKCWGILKFSWEEIYEANASHTQPIFGTISIVMCFLSPVMCALGNAYSHRIVLFMGGIIFSSSYLITSFAQNTDTLDASFGIMQGIALACLVGPTNVVLGIYFNKKRSLGNALALAGGSLGYLIWPHIFYYFIHHFGFRGALQIFAGLALHIVPAAMLCRPHSFYYNIQKGKEKTPKTSILTLKRSESHSFTPIAIPQKRSTPRESQVLPRLSVTEDNILHPKRMSRHSFRSARVPPTHQEKVIIKHCPFHHAQMHRFHVHDLHIKNVSFFRTYSCEAKVPLHQKSVHLNPLSVTEMQDVAPDKLTLIESRSTINLFLRDSELIHDTRITGFNTCMTLFCSCCPFDEDPKVIPLYEWGVLRNIFFALFLCGNALAVNGWKNIDILIPQYFASKGFTDDNISNILSVIGVADFVGKMTGAYLGDTDKIGRTNLTALASFGLCGVTLLVTNLPLNVLIVYGYSFTYGLFGGFYRIWSNVAVADLLHIGQLSSAFGFRIMMTGSVGFPFSFLVGYVTDVFLKGEAPMWLCCGFLFLGGTVILTINVAKRIKFNKNT